MNAKVKDRLPLWLTLVIYWLLTFALLGASLTKTNGHFGYPLDDTYIHMAIGKHFVNDGIWGVSLNGFSSSTSSPLWTFLIAVVYKVLGVNEWAPFVLCLLLGSILICYCFSLLQKFSNPIRRGAFLVFIMLLTPLPILTLVGMEHILHALLTVALIYGAASYLTTHPASPRQLTRLCVLAALVTLTRYEGLFLVFSIVLLFAAKKRFVAALLTGAAGGLPLILYGIISVAQGEDFLPNSVLIKGNAPSFSIKGAAAFLQHFPSSLVDAPHILVLMIACLVVYLWCEKQKVSGEKERFIIALFTLMTILHVQFAGMGWFYRYEAYIVLTGCVILADMVNALFSDVPAKSGNIFNYGAAIVLGLLIVSPLAWRVGLSFQAYPYAVMNIHEQQYQMGLFLQEYYSGKSIAANDIGAINYLADINTLDLLGIGSNEVARAMQRGLLDKNLIRTLVSEHNAEIVIIYNSSFVGKIPPEWIEIGMWQIVNNVVCGDDKVYFYAPSSEWENETTSHLKSFCPRLPTSVIQSGAYVSPCSRFLE